MRNLLYRGIFASISTLAVASVFGSGVDLKISEKNSFLPLNKPVEKKLPLTETAIGGLKGQTPVVVFWASTGHFYQVKQPFTKKSELYKILLDEKKRELLTEDVTATIDAKVSILVADFNVKNFDVKANVADIKFEAEKVPDLLKEVFGGITSVEGLGGQTEVSLDNIKSYAQGKNLGNFTETVTALTKIVKYVDDNFNVYIEAVDKAISNSANYDSFKKTIFKSPLPIDERKLIEKALNSAHKYLELYYQTEKQESAALKDIPLYQQAYTGAVQDGEKAKVVLTKYDDAVLVYDKTYGSADLSIDEDTFFGEAFMATAVDAKKVEGGGFTLDISLNPKKKDSGLQAQSCSMKIQTSNPKIAFSFSTGLAFTRVNDISVGKVDTADPAVKTIQLKGGQGNQISVTTAFVHTLFPAKGFKFGPTFGLGKRDEAMAYFAGLTTAFGNSQQFLLTLGYGWVPTRVLDGVDLGDNIGADANIPTKMTNKGAFFVGISYKF